MKVSILLAQHNVPLSLADHLSPLIRDIFDGSTAEGYACAKTKTSCILNRAVAPLFKNELISAMASIPYALSVDGSNDTGLEKINLLTVRIFDEENGKVNMRFLDMCITTGDKAATAEVIFNKINSVLHEHNIPWDNCVGVGVDNCSVNMGRHNSIMTRIRGVNSRVYFMGCPCHIAHNAASNAADFLRKDTKFDVEELLIDIFFWFDKSTKRKSSLQEYCCFCDIEYRKIIKHVSTRWLSLLTAIERVLKQFSGLKSYFMSESFSQARFIRLGDNFSNPMTEIYLLFYQSVLPIFTCFNLLLQREDPCIHLVFDQCEKLLSKLMGRFVLTTALSAASSPKKVDYLNNQLSDRDIFIGFITRQTLLKLVNEGDCTPTESKKFFHGVRAFYVAATKYIIEKFPFEDDVLKCAKFVNFEKRANCTFSDVEFFMHRYQGIAGLIVTDDIFDEFVDYQLLEQGDIPASVWDLATVNEKFGSHTRMDVIWGFLGTMRTGDNCNYKFPYLSKVAKLVLTLPHSNAGEERVFSLVRLNKTPYRSSLSLDGTLSSILTVKLHNPEPCYEFEPPKEMLEKSKKATWDYNKEHQKK